MNRKKMGLGAVLCILMLVFTSSVYAGDTETAQTYVQQRALLMQNIREQVDEIRDMAKTVRTQGVSALNLSQQQKISLLVNGALFAGFAVVSLVALKRRAKLIFMWCMGAETLCLINMGLAFVGGRAPQNDTNDTNFSA